MRKRVRRLSGLTRRQTEWVNREIDSLWERLGSQAPDTVVFNALRDQHPGLESAWHASYPSMLKHVRDSRPERSHRSPKFRSQRSRSLSRMFLFIPRTAAELGRLARRRRDAERELAVERRVAPLAPYLSNLERVQKARGDLGAAGVAVLGFAAASSTVAAMFFRFGYIGFMAFIVSLGVVTGALTMFMVYFWVHGRSLAEPEGPLVGPLFRRTERADGTVAWESDL